MTEVIKAQSAADFLALVPLLVGYEPSDSVLVIPFHGNRTMGVARFDIPRNEQAREAQVSVVADLLPSMQMADALVLVTYTNDPHSQRAAHGILATMNALLTMANNHGYLVRDALVVEPEHYYSVLDVEGGMERHPAERIAEARARLNVPEQPSGVTSLLRPHELTDGEKAETIRCIRALDERVRTGAPEDQPVDFDYLPEAIVAMGEGRATPLDMARLAVYSEYGALRDQMLAACITSVMLTDEQIVAFMTGQADTPPDHELLRNGVGWYWALADIVEEPERAAHLYNIAGWCAWALGLGSVAGVLLDRAAEEDPENTMQQLLRSFMQLGRVPGWAATIADQNAVRA